MPNDTETKITIKPSETDLEYEILRLENCLSFEPLKKRLKTYTFNFNPKGNYEQSTINEILSYLIMLNVPSGPF